MGAAVPFPFISGKALSPCVLLEVEGFRVEEPFPLQLSDEESSAKKDMWSPRGALGGPHGASLPRACLQDHPHVQHGCAAALEAPAWPRVRGARLVGSLPWAPPGARPAQPRFGPWDAAAGGMDTSARGCRAMAQLCSLVPHSTQDAAMPCTGAIQSLQQVTVPMPPPGAVAPGLE